MTLYSVFLYMFAVNSLTCLNVSCFFQYIASAMYLFVTRLTIVQAKLIDDKQKLLQGAGGKLQLQI